MKLSSNQLISALKSTGPNLRFSKLRIELEGDFSVQDAEWNYKDSLHHNSVHSQQIHQTNFLVEPNVNANIWYFNLFGLKIPLPIVNYSSSPNCQINVCPAFGFILIIANEWEFVSEYRSKVITTYHVGSHWILTPAHPILRFLAKRNYNALMTADLPMRARRTELRKKGATFSNESKGHFPYKEPEEVYKDFLIPPPQQKSMNPIRISISQSLSIGRPHWIGQDDWSGFKIVRESQWVRIYPRICPHEGASLDQAPCDSAKKLICPWHGRKISPIAEFDLSRSAHQTSRTTGPNPCMISLNGDFIDFHFANSTFRESTQEHH